MHRDDTRPGGLEGLVFTDTALSDVDGEEGRLIIAGELIEALAGRTSFEAVCARLWALGDGQSRAAETEAVRRELGLARTRAFTRVPALAPALRRADGMTALRGALAQLDDQDQSATALTAATAVFAAAWARLRAGEAPLAPDASAGHAADYLRMARGYSSSAAESAALDAYLVTVSDHGMNASTFAARVVTSTQSDPVSAIVAAVGALKGPLHGGAPGPVLDMLDRIGDAAKVRPWLAAELAAGRRIMGMGHRIYRVRDPRAFVLERALGDLERERTRESERLHDDERAARSGQPGGRLALARLVERTAEALLAERHPDRPLRANVEFYTALLLEALGLARAGFSATFAVGRCAGWLAHIAEQRRTGRLIRPGSRYVGPLPGEDGASED
jgi:citrate synthase